MDKEFADARHLSFTNLELLWQGGAPLVLPVHGNPDCALEFDPAGRSITLVTDYQTPEPDLAKLQHINFEPMYVDGREFARISVSVAGNVHGAYGLLATIADELQIANSPLARAVSAGVEQYKDILVARMGLTIELEVGLIGELMFLDYVIRTIGAGPGLATWHGPLSEEHDFAFEGFDVEVKTTVSERRRHIVTGTSQLVPRVGASLRLLSLQLTRAGATEGQNLSDWVANVRALAGGYVADLDRLLESIGWRAEDADLYPTRWAPRTRPRAYVVGPDFPAITDPALSSVVPNFGCLSDVSYRVDVTDLEHDALPPPLSGFVEKGINR